MTRRKEKRMNDWKATARLTRNPVTGTANNEKRTTYTQFDIAVNRDRKLEGEEQDADFWNCVAFGKTA
jgi:single-strand DNA-binding protein